MKNENESYSDIQCDCNNDNECLHKIPFTEEERAEVCEGLIKLFPQISEEIIRKALYYGESQEKK